MAVRARLARPGPADGGRVAASCARQAAPISVSDHGLVSGHRIFEMVKVLDGTCGTHSGCDQRVLGPQ